MAAERIPGGFGSKLREARERRGMSLRQIASATKISIGALEALERNQLSRLPGGIFSRAFVRSYAIEVGLDPDATIQEFIAQFPHDSLTAAQPTLAHSEDNEALESQRKLASAFLRLVAFSLPIVGVVLYYGVGRNSPGGRARASPSSTTARSMPICSWNACAACLRNAGCSPARPCASLRPRTSSPSATWISLPGTTQ